MTLHPHQHAALVAELRRPEYAGKAADAAFAALGPALESGEPGVYAPKRLARTRFVPAAKLERMRRHMKAERVMVFTPVEGDFQAGVPGFPNKVLREWFDLAWTEANS